MNPNDVGVRLREERVRLGYNQRDFGALAGIAKTTQLNYEKGIRNPDSSYLATAASAGVDVLYVVTGQRTPVADGAVPPEREVQLLRELIIAQVKGIHHWKNLGCIKSVVDAMQTREAAEREQEVT